MLPNHWQTSLRLWLEQRANRQNKPSRIAVLGVGNTQRSDDAAGVLVARKLETARLAPYGNSLIVIDAGPAPENLTAELRRFLPDVVLVIDAADMGQEPGDVRWIALEEIDGLSASTHSMPLSMLAKFLTLDLGCDVQCLGIQIRSNEVGETVSREVLQAIDEVTDGLDELLQEIMTFEHPCLN